MKPDITANQHRSQHPAGQSLVEFALVLPVLLLLVLGAMDLARMFSTKITLTNAAREGANYLSRHPDDAPGFANTVKPSTPRKIT
jgi:Flp pilus assembly protein TadG